jgi:hypothetical protein
MDETHEEEVGHIVNFVLDDDPAGAGNMRMIVVYETWYETNLVVVCWATCSRVNVCMVD